MFFGLDVAYFRENAEKNAHSVLLGRIFYIYLLKTFYLCCGLILKFLS